MDSQLFNVPVSAELIRMLKELQALISTRNTGSRQVILYAHTPLEGPARLLAESYDIATLQTLIDKLGSHEHVDSFTLRQAYDYLHRSYHNLKAVEAYLPRVISHLSHTGPQNGLVLNAKEMNEELLVLSLLFQHACEECHRVWDEGWNRHTRPLPDLR